MKAIKSVTLLLGLAGATIYAAGGCSVALNTTDVQCLSEAECLAKGPAFANTTCDPATKTCVPVDPNAGLCQTNQECITSLGADAICRKDDHHCVLLKSNECQTVYAQPTEVANDNTVVIGLIGGRSSQVSAELNAAVQLAQQDFSKSAKGLPPVTGSTATRPVVIVACATAGATEQSTAAAHLVNDLHVPVIIGPAASSDALNTEPVSLPNKVLSILPSATDPIDLPNPAAPTPMIWRISPGDSVLGPTMVSTLAADICIPPSSGQGCDPTSRLVQLGNVPAGQPIKVMVVEDTGISGFALGTLVQNNVSFNCSFFSPCTALDNAAATPPANFTGAWPSYSLGIIQAQFDPVNNPNPSASNAALISSILTFKPNVIFWSGGGGDVATIFIPLETAWSVQNSSVPPPVHVTNTNWTGSMTAFMKSTQGVKTNLRQRVLFASALSSPDATGLADFSVRFNNAFPQFPPPYVPIVSQWSDGAYLAFYAMAAVGSAPLTGVNIGSALAAGRLNPPGTTIHTNPSDVAQGIATAFGGQNIDITGLSGPLDFDLKLGYPHSDGRINCFNSTFAVVDSGFGWVSATNTTTGSISNCN
jgi:hypothetical protein